MKSIAVLISGRGSNLQAIAGAALEARISVISNRPGAGGLDFARSRAMATEIVDDRTHPSRESFDDALAAALERARPDLVVLAGFMRILGDAFVQRYSGRLLNIHPSLLPAFPGLHTHRRALEAGVKIHGCTVHYVTAQLDNGPIIVQAAVPVLPGDDEARLAARVLEQEHRIYPRAVRWFLEDRLVIENGVVRVDGGEGGQLIMAS